jgi:uncharacterized lipoprotein
MKHKMFKQLSRLFISALFISVITACSTSPANENNDNEEDTARLTHSNEAPRSPQLWCAKGIFRANW